MRGKTKVLVSEVKNKSGTLAFRVDLGVVNGRRQFKQFPLRDQAEAFAHDCNVKIEAKQLQALGDLSEVMLHKHALMNAINRLKAVGATVEQATDFFLKFAKPINGRMTIVECIHAWTQEKTRIGCSPKYINGLTRFDFKEFQEEFGEQTQISEVTTDEFTKYLFGKTTWNSNSKMSHIRVISMLFNYALANGWVTRNPIDKVSRPRLEDKMADVLKPRDVDTLLRYLRTQSKVAYRQNAMRHSFASYFLMKYENAEKACLQLGHVGDYKTLFSHYRNLVSKLDADRYFSIVPRVRIRKFVKKLVALDPLTDVSHFFDDTPEKS